MLRLILRIPAILLWTIVLYPFLILSNILPPWTARSRFMNRAAVVQLWCRGLAHILGMRLHLRGAAPKPPFILVANHLGYLDIILLGATVPCYFLSRSDVRNWPVIGLLARSANVHFITRENKKELNAVNEQILEVYEQGCGLVFFPEGTSTRGQEVLPFKSSLFKPAARKAIPVHHAMLRYETPVGAPHPEDLLCWWGDDPFGPHILKLLKAKRFSAFVTFGRDAIMRPDRKELARDLHSEVSAVFNPVSQEPR